MVQTNSEKHYRDHMCPECGSRVHEQSAMYINECDRCLAQKVE